MDINIETLFSTESSIDSHIALGIELVAQKEGQVFRLLHETSSFSLSRLVQHEATSHVAALIHYGFVDMPSESKSFHTAMLPLHGIFLAWRRFQAEILDQRIISECLIDENSGLRYSLCAAFSACEAIDPLSYLSITA